LDPTEDRLVGTGEAAGPGRAARPAFLARARLAHGKGPALERLLVESANRFLGDTTIGVIDECKPSRPPRLTIDRQDDLCWRPHTRKMFAQIRLVGGVRQVP
jgi:hypothetical protein